MNAPYLYEVDGQVFLDRMRRVRALTDEMQPGHTVDVASWSARMHAIHAEADRLTLTAGMTYRLRFFYADHRVVQGHGDTADGHIVFDVPVVTDADLREWVGTYLGRGPQGHPAQGLLVFSVDGLHYAVADVDVLRCEAVG